VGMLGRAVRRCRRSPLATSLGLIAVLVLAVLSTVGLRMKREIHRLELLAPDPRPWTPIFDGHSMACFMRKNPTDWRLENGVLVNAVPQPMTLQTERMIEDGDVRVRFECHESSYLGFNIRLGMEQGYGVEWDRAGVNQIAGAEHELLFQCRGDRVEATLDGRPLNVIIHHRTRKGTLHFCAMSGTLRVRSIDFRDAP
jgi:hypothetical protein